MCIVGYWPSYNIPFYPIIYNLTGYLAVSTMIPSMTPVLSYQVSARSNIMRRDQHKIVDIASLQEFSRHNGMYLRQLSTDQNGQVILYYWAASPACSA